jgi:transcriptional regulator with XRE-family HTH domain
MNLSLKLALIKARLPQYEAARRLQMTETRLSRIVCGRLAPTPGERAGLAHLLGVSEPELFPGGADQPSSQTRETKAKPSRSPTSGQE